MHTVTGNELTSEESSASSPISQQAIRRTGGENTNRRRSQQPLRKAGVTRPILASTSQVMPVYGRNRNQKRMHGKPVPHTHLRWREICKPTRFGFKANQIVEKAARLRCPDPPFLFRADKTLKTAGGKTNQSPLQLDAEPKLKS